MPLTYSPLQLWNKHWLLDGVQVSCRLCNQSRPVLDLGAFVHAPECTMSRFSGQYPIQDLCSIVERRAKDRLF